MLRDLIFHAHQKSFYVAKDESGSGCIIYCKPSIGLGVFKL